MIFSKYEWKLPRPSEVDAWGKRQVNARFERSINISPLTGIVAGIANTMIRIFLNLYTVTLYGFILHSSDMANRRPLRQVDFLQYS